MTETQKQEIRQAAQHLSELLTKYCPGDEVRVDLERAVLSTMYEPQAQYLYHVHVTVTTQDKIY